MCDIWAVGTFANVDPAVERYVAKKLKLNIDLFLPKLYQEIGMPSFFQLLELLVQ